jgi:SAM-dependent methyltransferase
MVNWRRIARSWLPGGLHEPARNLYRLLMKLVYLGTSRYCCLCDSGLRRFVPAHDRPEGRDVRCPVCDSCPRHRLAWLYMREETDFLDGRPKRMLHIAPEKRMAELFSRAPGVDYLSGDVAPDAARAMVPLDVTDIHLPDDEFDVVYCCHVLEHVRDDRRAMAELFRVTKPGGWAIVQVPLSDRAETLEDPAVRTPAEREKQFGHPAHVRAYGRDFADRLEAAGFLVRADTCGRALSAAEVRRLGLPQERDLYCCRKPERRGGQAPARAGRASDGRPPTPTATGPRSSAVKPDSRN